MQENMMEIEKLSPAELAVLWLANNTYDDKQVSPVVLASNSTLTLMIVLANGVAILENDEIISDALKIISNYSRELVAHIESRGGYIRYDQPVKKLIESLSDIGFPILPKNYVIPDKELKRSKASISYELANEQYEVALQALENNELLIDPPWYKTKAAAAGINGVSLDRLHPPLIHPYYALPNKYFKEFDATRGGGKMNTNRFEPPWYVIRMPGGVGGETS